MGTNEITATVDELDVVVIVVDMGFGSGHAVRWLRARDVLACVDDIVHIGVILAMASRID